LAEPKTTEKTFPDKRGLLRPVRQQVSSLVQTERQRVA
jgi:hypothetical protein